MLETAIYYGILQSHHHTKVTAKSNRSKAESYHLSTHSGANFSTWILKMQEFLKDFPAGFCRWNLLFWAAPYKCRKAEHLISYSLTKCTWKEKLPPGGIVGWLGGALTVNKAGNHRQREGQLIPSGGFLTKSHCIEKTDPTITFCPTWQNAFRCSFSWLPPSPARWAFQASLKPKDVCWVLWNKALPGD